MNIHDGGMGWLWAKGVDGRGAMSLQGLLPVACGPPTAEVPQTG